MQVTLQILAALIEKAPRDLPLYAPYVLKILNLILKSRDITMLESSIPTFEAFCEHHDGASLSADQEYLHQYEEIVRMYTSFASTRQWDSKTTMSPPVCTTFPLQTTRKWPFYMNRFANLRRWLCGGEMLAFKRLRAYVHRTH